MDPQAAKAHLVDQERQLRQRVHQHAAMSLDCGSLSLPAAIVSEIARHFIAAQRLDPELFSPQSREACEANRRDVTQIMNACTWAALCHATCADEALWQELLLDDYARMRYGSHLYGLCTLMQTMQVTGLSTRQMLLRVQQPVTVQQMLDAHRALCLDDVASFVATARMAPNVLITNVGTNSGGKKLAVYVGPGGAASFTQRFNIDPRVDRFIERHTYQRARLVHADLGTVLRAAKSREIMCLIKPYQASTEYSSARLRPRDRYGSASSRG